MNSLASSIAWTGAAYLASVLTIALTRAPLGSPLFLACAAAAAGSYTLILWRTWREDRAPRRLLFFALGLAVAFRVPLAIPAAGGDSDMMRYVWDGRAQLHGYNPYLVLPADPALSAVHTDETRQMPSAGARTPYPPAAQLFFRLVVMLHDSSRAMRLALVGCDLLTVLVLWRWLVASGRSPWLVLAYAWNPLVVLEIAHSGHIDALGALWIAASAYWLAGRRTALATLAFVLAVATKVLPIVLLPLYWRRIRLRDAAAGAILFALLYLPFVTGAGLPFSGVANVVAHVTFNGPVFRSLAAIVTRPGAAAVALAVGLGLALWARGRLLASDPAAWAWPMAAALACGPVIYPWYLLYFTPFLFAVETLPLAVWTITIIPVYVVWEMVGRGGRWVVPGGLLAAEYGVPLAVLVCAWFLRRRRGALPLG